MWILTLVNAFIVWLRKLFSTSSGIGRRWAAQSRIQSRVSRWPCQWEGSHITWHFHFHNQNKSCFYMLLKILTDSHKIFLCINYEINNGICFAFYFSLFSKTTSRSGPVPVSVTQSTGLQCCRSVCVCETYLFQRVKGVFWIDVPPAQSFDVLTADNRVLELLQPRPHQAWEHQRISLHTQPLPRSLSGVQLHLYMEQRPLLQWMDWHQKAGKVQLTQLKCGTMALPVA